MGRGGDSVQVAVIPKDKKDRCVFHRQVSRVISGDETGHLRPLCSWGGAPAVVTVYPLPPRCY